MEIYLDEKDITYNNHPRFGVLRSINIEGNTYMSVSDIGWVMGLKGEGTAYYNNRGYSHSELETIYVQTYHKRRKVKLRMANKNNALMFAESCTKAKDRDEKLLWLSEIGSVGKYVSVKEFSRLANVSPQSVYYRLSTPGNKLNRYTKTINGRKMINPQAIQELCIGACKVGKPMKISHTNTRNQAVAANRVFEKGGATQIKFDFGTNSEGCEDHKDAKDDKGVEHAAIKEFITQNEAEIRAEYEEKEKLANKSVMERQEEKEWVIKFYNENLENEPEIGNACKVVGNFERLSAIVRENDVIEFQSVWSLYGVNETDLYKLAEDLNLSFCLRNKETVTPLSKAFIGIFTSALFLIQSDSDMVKKAIALQEGEVYESD